MVYAYRFNKNIFGYPYEDDEPVDLVRCYFDTMYDSGFFLDALSYWVQRVGYGTDGAWGNFGDMDDPDEFFHFEGVEIEVGFSDPPDVIRIDEATFFRWLRMACDRYVRQNPGDKRKVEELLAMKPTGKPKGGAPQQKIVYDPEIYSDEYLAQLGAIAAEKAFKKGLNKAVDGGFVKSFTETAGGVWFRFYVDEVSGLIRNFHPIAG